MTMRPPVPFAVLRVRIFERSSTTICRPTCTEHLPRAILRGPSQPFFYRSISSASSSRLSASYFLPNNNAALERTSAANDRIQTQGARSSSTTGIGTTTTTTTATETATATASPNPTSDSSRVESQHTPLYTDLPHRRRQARRKSAQQTTDPSSNPSNSDVLPSQDASSTLTTVAAGLPKRSLRRTLSAFLSLSKPRLTVLVVLTAMAPYALYPVPSFLTPAVTESPSLSPLTLLFLTTGTALCSASANALNMLYEPATDAQMSRTRNRPLVRNLVSRRAALAFAAVAAALGTGALYFGVNPTVSFLGAANIALYAGVYTPLKAVTAANTWVGALVGGVPPLMGWAAAAGESATTVDGSSWRELLLAPDGGSLGGWLLAALLVAWQFPHFMALSWSIRHEYRAAGLRMLAWTNPARNARVSLRYSAAFIPVSLGLCAAGVVEWSFAVTSLPVNGWLLWQAVRFWRFEGHKGSARGLFWASVWHLPAVMVLALLQKKGMWGRVWRGVVGYEAADDDDDEWEDELDEMPVVTTPSPPPKV